MPEVGLPRSSIHPGGDPRPNWTWAPGVGEREEAAREWFQDDLNQTHEFDPAEPAPIPEGDFD